MTDPFDALRAPAPPAQPDPSFTARLRERLTRAVLNPGRTRGDDMAAPLTRREPAWPPALTPYLVVSDARAALDWYTEVFDARQRGEAHVDADGTVGHMEVDIGDAVLMFAEHSDLYPDVPVRAPESPTTFSHSLHLQLPNVDDTVALAQRRGATVERPPRDEPYGRAGVIVDPFGHRWLLLQPPAHATRYRQGDIAHVTMVTPDPARARQFYETVLQVPFQPGRAAGAWGTEETRPQLSMWSPENTEPQVQLCYRVDDIAAATARVREAGGHAAETVREPHGLMSECVDDQGTHFQLWQPPN
ncbi:VOC family protein [Actinophytocola algeriensis]|uniref:Putative glyoxalase superfamily protein PhnB n=1 Tax=Actinophytocola algeriensis TaxID=1768010 RepID=A0A7W7QCS0_9PSEU|nr:VOC family protein [Actinophytocola algeriensis]MBB4910736.1 putative glyoxalase superfamily protein PhnB [Actinophytocola algeriensis]MBE1473729.1 putative glyoxalase superfamily protein PhnB [Actinophytocola algeriensis]